MAARARLWGWLAILGVLIGVWVLNVSRVGRPAGCLEGCVTSGERQPGPLRVTSLNMLHGFPRFEHLPARLDLIAGEVQRQDADIVCLQEVPWRPRLGNVGRYLAERTGLNYVYLRANGNRWAILFEEGEAILSRYPLRDVDFTELTPQAGFFEHRVALTATVVTPWGDVRVVVTYLTDGEPAINRAQAESLMTFVERLGSGPAIVAGDFNAKEDSPQIRELAGRWVDTYRAAHPDDVGFTCCVDDLTHDPGEPLEKRIDYVFLLPDDAEMVRVVDSRRVLDQPSRIDAGWLWASDHVGLLTTINVTYSHNQASSGACQRVKRTSPVVVLMSQGTLPSSRRAGSKARFHDSSIHGLMMTSAFRSAMVALAGSGSIGFVTTTSSNFACTG